MEAAVKEYESSITLPITRLLFDKCLSKHEPLSKSAVIYYPDNVRISDNVVQKKKVISRHNVMKIHHGENNHRDSIFLPLVRKYAIECPDKLPQNIYTTKLMIVRYVLFKKVHSSYSIRICVEKHSSRTAGGSFALTAEVEYSQKSSRLYGRLNAIENEFLEKLMEMCGSEIREIDFEQVYSNVEPGNMVNVPSRVWSRFSEEKAYCKTDAEAITFKYDGYKSRLMHDGHDILFYDDLHNMKRTNSPWFDFAPKIVFQAEVMSATAASTIPSLILVDILGAYVGKTLFMPEPMDVLRLFVESRLNQRWPPHFVNLGTMGKYKLCTQSPISGGVVDSLPTCENEAFDGYIVTIANRIFKYKIPTLDVRCIGGCLHLDDTINAITATRFHDLEENCIYEVAPSKSGGAGRHESSSFKVLRKRVDRIYTSSLKEYEEFKTELEFIRNFKPVHSV